MGNGMIKKVNFNLDLRDVIDDTKRKNNIIEPMDIINDELLSQLVDEMVSSHIKDFIRNYIKKEMGLDYNVGGLEFDGNLLF